MHVCVAFQDYIFARASHAAVKPRITISADGSVVR